MEIRPKNVSPVAHALAGASGKAHHFLTSDAGRFAPQLLVSKEVYGLHITKLKDPENFFYNSHSRHLEGLLLIALYMIIVIAAWFVGF